MKVFQWSDSTTSVWYPHLRCKYLGWSEYQWWSVASTQKSKFANNGNRPSQRSLNTPDLKMTYISRVIVSEALVSSCINSMNTERLLRFCKPMECQSAINAWMWPNFHSNLSRLCIFKEFFSSTVYCNERTHLERCHVTEYPTPALLHRGPNKWTLNLFRMIRIDHSYWFCPSMKGSTSSTQL